MDSPAADPASTDPESTHPPHTGTPVDLADPSQVHALLDLASVGAATLAGVAPDPAWGRHAELGEDCPTCAAWAWFDRLQTALGAPAHPRPAVAIDLNVRLPGGLTYAGFEDVTGPLPSAGEAVLAVEPESGLRGPAVVTGVDEAKKLLHLAVAWRELQPR